jgi:hypothetical protein
MSIQLIVYPQTFDGSPNPITGSSSQFIVDGIDFKSVNTSDSSLSLSAPTYTSAINTLVPTMAINTWYRFSGDADTVTQSGGAITIESSEGIIQQLSNLSIGTTYDFTIDVGTYASTLQLQQYVGTVLVGAFPISVSGTTTIQLEAQSTSDILLIYSTATNVINSMSVMQSGIQPSGAIQYPGNGQVICDLYEDEDIPLSLSVDDFKNVAEQVQSYSKAFNLPGTKRNNKIFDNMFSITRSDDGIIFNPYVKTQCKLKQDGFILFEGYLRMIDIQDKQGEISYNVNLYSEVIALADVLGDLKFSELDFRELEHDYNKDQIKYSWNDSGTGITYLNSSTSGFRDANSTLKYPFVNWNNEWIIANNPGGTTGPTDGFPQLLSLEQAFRPFINIKYLIDRIFNQPDFQFTYESTFFDTTDFKKLYMDFNWGSDAIPTQIDGNTYNGFYFYDVGDGSGLNYATTSYDVMNLSYNIPLIGGLTPPNYDDATNIITSTVVNEQYNIVYSYEIENIDTGGRYVNCRWLKNNTDEYDLSGTILIPPGGTFTYTGTLTQTLTTIGDTLKVEFKTDAGTANKVRQSTTTFPNNSATVVFNVGIGATTSGTLLQTARGEIGQWDFLKGIMTMFNLVSIPDKNNPNHIKIEPYNDIFLENTDSTQLNWTDKIDVEEMKLEPLTDLNKKTIFKFVEDENDFAFQNYKIQVQGHLYGSQKWDASTDQNNRATIFIGEKEIIAEPFAATVPKPLVDFQFGDFIVPSIYSYNPDDGTSEGFDNSPRIMYNNGKKTLVTCTYYIPEQNGLSSENQSQFLQFSHLSEIPTLSSTVDFHFGVCQLIPPIGNSPVKNLFSVYWFPYISELYNPDTRIMTIKVNLTPGDISTFNFYDTVIIKNREFRVNKIDYKPNDLATIEFILIP